MKLYTEPSAPVVADPHKYLDECETANRTLQKRLDEAEAVNDTISRKLEHERTIRKGADRDLVSALKAMKTNIARIADLETNLAGSKAECKALTEAAQFVVGKLVPLPERLGSESTAAQLTRVPERAKVLAKESAELSSRQALALVKSYFPALDLGPVGEGASDDCTPEDFEKYLKEVAPAAPATVSTSSGRRERSAIPPGSPQRCPET